MELSFGKHYMNNILSVRVRGRVPKFISYELDGKTRKYHPDFLLVDSNVIIEIKGYW